MNSGFAAFWLSPGGDILPVPTTHIHYVIDDPCGFGLTLDEIQKIYARHGEAPGTEAWAREEIILRLVKRGWIRIRKYHRPDRWSVNVENLSPRAIATLRNWAGTMIDSGESGYEGVWMDLPAEMRKVTLGDMASDLSQKSR